MSVNNIKLLITIKEIVRELKIQRKIDFHDNIIRCYGIAKFESSRYYKDKNHDNNINYMDFPSRFAFWQYISPSKFNQISRFCIGIDTPEDYIPDAWIVN
ncbi:unnamed protein product [Rhizophagus irregularis]|nr:unnamed protein product [Rhizophagus irregularis]